ncbi:hypothetical protein KVR01_003555 [Diaporthe batatas]|uniref:uncharacterized protein n=1 Tax=Diaporthe batatas TaxID=748121 RepID=UPI001D0583E5|nr:uncharacterized protein KVR01_003555 [Diaporthe batatas]KAG8167866.1 hypothetical protein KVR01_003555 [Diaporthe batatas]
MTSAAVPAPDQLWIFYGPFLTRTPVVMEKPTRLADLKLVNKYYPSVSNYSYPRHDSITTHRCENPLTGRSSVGSECSVPEMVDDQESDISAEDTNQSHIVCDETFDSFWEDSEAFWGIESGERSNTILIGPTTHSTASQQEGGRTLPPETGRHAPHRSVDNVENDSKPCWPLVAADPCVAPTPKPSKAIYSLFPPPTAAPQHGLLLRRPGGGQTGRNEIPRDTLKQLAPTVSLPLPNRRKKPRKLHLPASDGAIRYDSSSLTQSAPGTPTFLIASPTAVAFSRRSQQTLPSQRNFSLSRAHSDIKIVHCPPSDIISQAPPTQLAVPAQTQDVPRGRKTHQRTHSQLRQSISANEVPSNLRITPSPTNGAAQAPRNPTGNSRPTTPQTQQTVLPVSVFDFDSDSDSDADSAANFARRIVKNLTPHKRSRSASAAPRSRKGSDIAEKQLRRARADTVTSATEGQSPPANEETGLEDKENDGPHAVPALRRQKSEVFGTIFGRKR